MDTLKKIEMLKKGKKEMSPVEQKAKSSVISDIQALAAKAMSGKMQNGLKKVTVASDSKEGLKEGLDKAKDITSEMPNGEESMEHEGSESEDFEAGEMEGMHEGSELDAMSEEELDQKIQELLAKKKELEAKKQV